VLLESRDLFSLRRGLLSTQKFLVCPTTYPGTCAQRDAEGGGFPYFLVGHDRVEPGFLCSSTYPFGMKDFKRDLNNNNNMIGRQVRKYAVETDLNGIIIMDDTYSVFFHVDDASNPEGSVRFLVATSGPLIQNYELSASELFLHVVDDCQFHASVCLVISFGCSFLTCGSIRRWTLDYVDLHGLNPAKNARELSSKQQRTTRSARQAVLFPGLQLSPMVVHLNVAVGLGFAAARFHDDTIVTIFESVRFGILIDKSYAS
jgi:hypothetical protein